MLADTNERPGIEERYETATQASSLLVESHRQGAADVLIAAGWSDSRVGMALLRLHSEWDGAAKPRRATEAQIEAMADLLRESDAKALTEESRKGPPQPRFVKPGEALPRARTQAALWYAKELRILAQSLKSRAVVYEQVQLWATMKGIDPANIAPALLHWLAPTCVVCDGHGLRKVPDAPALSGKRCHRCGGTGKEPRPEGAARIQNHLDYCVTVARNSLRKRLRPGG